MIVPGKGNGTPVEEESTRNLWFGFAWVSSIGLLALLYTLPLLLPWHSSFAAFLLLGLILVFEGLVVSGLWPLAKEIYRRRKQTKL
jgi:hypothetical protein